VSGRKRGAQRSGTTKFIAPLIGASFVQDLITINKDVRLATYTARTVSPSVEWAESTPSDNLTRDVVITLGGDIWCISGKNILAKYNSAGAKVLEVQLPLTFDDEEGKSIALDSDGGVFVSTQTTAERYAGKIFRYEPKPTDDTQLDLIWTRTSDARIPSISFRAGVLYAIENKATETTLRALGELSSDVPISIVDRPVPNPSTQVHVNTPGDVLVASAPKAGRDIIPTGSFCGAKSVAWDPLDLGIGKLRCWLDASRQAEFTNNQDIDFLTDWSGNSRNVWAASEGEGPVASAQKTYGGKYIDDGICGLPGIRFDGAANAFSVFPGFTSGIGDLALIPPDNTPSFICMIFKVRSPGFDATDVNDFGKVLERGGQPYFTVWQSINGKFFHGELTNPTVLDNTGVSGIDEPAADSRIGGMSVLNEGDICILTIAFDPSLDTTVSGAETAREGSFFRVNGATAGIYTDQFTLQDFRSGDATRIAYSVWGGQHANMDMCELIVVEDDYQWPSDFTESGAPSSGLSSGASSGAIPDWPGEPSGAPSSIGYSDIEKVEAYLAHRYGVQDILHASHPFKAAPPVAGSGVSSGSSSGPSSDVDVLNSPDGIISKYTAAGLVLRWAISGPGLGFGVVTDEDDGVYCLGPSVVPASGASSGVFPAEETTIRKVVDEGFTVSDSEASGVGAWTYTTDDPSVQGIRMAIDSEKNLYVPINDADASPTLLKIKSDGLVEWSYLTPASSTVGFCCAIDTIATDFGDDTIGEPEFLYLGTGLATSGHGLNTLYKLRLVDVSVAVGAPRENVHLAVSEGNIRRMVPGGVPEVVTVTDGAAALNSASRIVMSAISQGKVYYIDGEQYRVYDPDTDTASEWVSTGAGTLPKRAKIIVEWAGKIVLARVEGEPQNAYFSETGNPHGWDLFPPVLKPTSAYALAATQAGPVPDTINTLIAYSDNQLIIGGDHSIHILVGNPLAGALDPARGTFPSGQIRLVSDTIGMAFGRSWCRDESGVVYFFGSRGGLYRMVPGSVPQKLSTKIDRRIKELDLNFFTVRLVWNTVDRGVHLYFVPIDVVPPASGPASSGASSGASSAVSSGPSSVVSSGVSSGVSGASSVASSGPTAISGPDPIGGIENPTDQAASGDPILHWFWFAEDGSWWSDRFPLAGMDPTAVAVADGDDPSDRVMLIGGEDGYVRFWDDSSSNDDLVAMSSSVTIGPIRPKSFSNKSLFSNFQIALSSDQDGGVLRLFRSNEADLIGAIIATRTIVPGRNPSWRKRVRGQSVFLQLLNETINERFAFEAASVDIIPGGRVRV